MARIPLEQISKRVVRKNFADKNEVLLPSTKRHFLQPTFDRKRETIILCQKYPLTKYDDLNTQQIETLLFSNFCTSLFSTTVKMQNGKDFGFCDDTTEALSIKGRPLIVFSIYPLSGKKVIEHPPYGPGWGGVRWGVRGSEKKIKNCVTQFMDF